MEPVVLPSPPSLVLPGSLGCCPSVNRKDKVRVAGVPLLTPAFFVSQVLVSLFLWPMSAVFAKFAGDPPCQHTGFPSRRRSDSWLAPASAPVTTRSRRGGSAVALAAFNFSVWLRALFSVLSPREETLLLLPFPYSVDEFLGRLSLHVADRKPVSGFAAAANSCSLSTFVWNLALNCDH